MKIFIISYYFPPTNTVAAQRLAAAARFLRQQGHDVKIIAAESHMLPRDFYTDLSEIEVIETRASLFGHRKRLRAISDATSFRSQSGTPKRHSLKRTFLMRRLREFIAIARHLAVWPDRHVGWLRVALPAALRVARRWQPDVIYASSPPATCMALGALVSRLAGVPWVCEIRDRWADDPYYPRPRWRKIGERALERAMLGSARGIVTVSETWARDYGARYGKPATAIYSGFDPEVYHRASTRPAPGLPLRLVYTGSVYAGRDPTPLWRALAAMGAAADDICVEFYGAQRAEVLPGAAAHGVDHLVHVEEYVSHERAVELQCGADMLLLLQWDSPSEAGNIPGKLFEYIGAGRPILAIGYAQGEMAGIIAQRKVGLFTSDAGKIANLLREFLISKRNEEPIPGTDRECLRDLTLEAQFRHLDETVLCG